MSAVVRLKKIVKPYVPMSAIPVYDKVRKAVGLQTARGKFEQLRGAVHSAVEAIAKLTPEQCVDTKFLEHKFIPSLGLNNEGLDEQPSELSAYFGTGLHIWQYPNQLAKYLVWLSQNAPSVKKYAEIGPRWGGMFILTTQWLKKNGGNISEAVAIDPIDQSPLLQEYFKIMDGGPIKLKYIQAFSNSAQVQQYLMQSKPDFVFIDGDHSMRGAFADHMLARKFANIIAHHDVASSGCIETKELWGILKELESDKFKFSEFVDQYPSVKGDFLGIGVMERI